MLECFALSDKGCVRANNEDYCEVKPELGLYVLADGMGGAKAGETAARLAVDTVVECVKGAAQHDSQALLGAFEEANRRVLARAAADPNLDGMGTTLVAALEIGNEIGIASVGDSRAYLLDKAGFRAITQDQTWINEVGRPLGIDESSLRNHPMRHVLTMAIGAGSALSINYYMIQLQPTALLLLCSDGLHGLLEPEDIEKILRAGDKRKLEEKCRALIDAAREAGAPDNVSAVLVRPPGRTAA